MENGAEEPEATKGKCPDDATLAIAFYNAARAEVVQRLTMRDTTVLAWIATAGVLLGVAVKDQTSAAAIAELLPVISLAFAMAIYRHTFIIETLGLYRRDHLDKFLRQDEPAGSVPMHWDTSPTLQRRQRPYLALEQIAYLLLTTGPPAGCVWYLWRHNFRFHDHPLLVAGTCTGLLLIGFAIEIFRNLRLKSSANIPNP